jgi:hypothetical protein
MIPNNYGYFREVGEMKKLRRILRRIYNRVRFGRVTAHITGTAGHNVAAEIEYRDKNGEVVGFWAYGSWDPSYPYREPE